MIDQRTIAAEIANAFANEEPEAEGAQSDDLRMFGFEWNFKDGSALWVDFDSDDGISVRWRKTGAGTILKFKPV